MWCCNRNYWISKWNIIKAGLIKRVPLVASKGCHVSPCSFRQGNLICSFVRADWIRGVSLSGKPLVLLVAVTTQPASSGWICTEHTEPSPWQGPQGEALVEEELGDFCSVLGLGNDPRKALLMYKSLWGHRDGGLWTKMAGWCCRTPGLESSFQGKLLDLGPIFLAGLSPSSVLFSSSNILLLILQDSVSQASLMSQAGMVMWIHASLALETNISAIFNSYGHSLCLLWSRFCAEH